MKRSLTRAALGLAALSLSPGAARAQGAAASHVDDAGRAEAAERFDRGLRLFNGGDNAGALAEFRRAYALIPNVLVLYNIGLVYAQMGRAVEATDALDGALASPAGLSPERVAIGRRTRDEQAARIAEVTVTANVDGASVELDGVEAGKLPLARPLRVTSGTHVIGAVAPGYAPLRKEVTIASGEKQSLDLALVAMQGRVAHLAVKTHLPGAEVFADGQRIGTTPLSASVSLSPGTHAIELRRDGYATARGDVALGDGATGEVTLEPEPDAAALATSGGSLALDVDQTQAVVLVDGRSQGVYAAPLRLAPGPHRLIVERGDFEPVERDVVIEPGRTLTVRLFLEPTPDYRARYVAHARSQRTWGLVSAIGGLVAASAGVVLVAYDAEQRSDGSSTLSSLQAQSAKNSNMACDPGQRASTYTQRCVVPTAAANAKIDDANTRDYGGWAAVAVGAAGVALGVTLYVLSDDPHRFDRRDPAPGASASRAPLSLWATPDGGGLSVAGAF
jgi:hypothetical protein